MICSDCRSTGNKSKVFRDHVTNGNEVVPEYFDEEGRYHCHNPNIKIIHYKCSNGHMLAEELKSNCPSCDFAP
jgi:hypothetical protein